MGEGNKEEMTNPTKEEQKELLQSQLKDWTAKLYDILKEDKIDTELQAFISCYQAIYQYGGKLKKLYQVDPSE